MLMRDVEIRNEELKGLLKNLEVEVLRIINEQEDLVKEVVQDHLNTQDPEARLAAGKKGLDGIGEASALFKFAKEKGSTSRELYDAIIKASYNHPGGSELTNGFPTMEHFASYRDLQKKQAYQGNLFGLINDISYKYLGGGSMALAALYPPGGSIGWHHNGNAPGYNILFHYSIDGDGYFRTVHEDKFVDYPDKKGGWVCRAGLFKSAPQFRTDVTTDERKDIVVADNVEDCSWHSAYTKGWRFTLSTILNNVELREDVIEEIETP